MPRYNKEDILRIVEEEDVGFIRLQFADIFGNLKNIAITVGQLPEVLENGCLFDGSAIEGFVRVENSDMFLVPDLDTFAIFPWRPQKGKVARMICDIYHADRKTPFEGDPRFILKKVVKEAEEMGYTFNVGPECEFFLFDLDDRGYPTTESSDRGTYFDMGPADNGENARRDIVLTLEEMGYEIEASHHESAPAQHEIDFKYGRGLATADNIMTFKLVVKTIARRHGMHASFMPKPKEGINGSGLHLNMSLFSGEQNIFEDTADSMGLSKEAYYFIGGLMDHLKGMTLFTNPIVNSYKRLVPGYEAPVYIAWSSQNRSPLIRIPASGGKGTRVELRGPDSAANPYLALAVCLAAGLNGIRRKSRPPKCITENLFNVSKEERLAQGIEQIPTSLMRAVEAFEKDEFVKNVVGEHITRCYAKAKTEEYREYAEQVSEWEIRRYLDII